MNFTVLILLMAELLGNPSEVPECRKFEENLYLYSALNNTERVDGYIDSLSACGNDTPEALMTIGRYFYNRSDYYRTKETFLKVIGMPELTDAQLGQAHYYVGLAGYYSADYPLAEKHFLQARKFDYQPSWTLNCLGLVAKATKNYSRSVEYFRQAIELDPEYALAYNNAGTTFDAMGDEPLSLHYYLLADSLCGHSSALYRSNVTRTYRDMGLTAQHFASASIGYEKFPDDELTLYDMANAFNKEERYSESRPILYKLLRMQPTTSSEWFSVAHIYDGLGKRDSAYYYYRLSLKLDPDRSSAIHNIGIIYKQYGMFEKAHEYYDRALELNPDDHLLYNSKVQVYTWQRDFENALEWCNIYCEKYGDKNNYCPLNKGYILLQMNRYEEAIPWFERQLEDHPKDDRAFNNMARCYAELGQYEKAFAYFDKALECYPLNSYVFHNRAALYYDLQEYDKACADLKRSIDLEYTWTIDPKLETMRDRYCPEVNTKRTIVINEYTGNERELIGQGFIQLNDSIQEENLNFELSIQEPEVFSAQSSNTSSIFDSFKVYPNPSTGLFRLAASEIPEAPLDVKVYDTSGRLISMTKLIGSEAVLDLSGESKGNYVAMIMNNASVLSTQKLVLVD